MEKNLREEIPLDFSPDIPLLSDVEEEVLRQNESHGMALNRPFGEECTEESISEQSNINFNLTVFTRVQLSARQRSLLLSVLNYQAVHYGVNFNMLLAIWSLYLGLLGSKKTPLEEKEGYIRLTLVVSQIILKTLQEFHLNLDPGQKVQLPDHIKKYLIKYGLMTKRTYSSRFRTWRPEEFLIVKTVPVDIKFLERQNNTQPYISYCKGYGESHPSAHRHKTKFSAELDGEDSETEEKSKGRKSLSQLFDPSFNLSNFLFEGFNSLWARMHKEV